MEQLQLTLENLNKIIEKEINPILKFHQGGIEIRNLDVDKKILTIRMYGGCAGCPSSLLTLYNGIVPVFQEHFPKLEVELE